MPGAARRTTLRRGWDALPAESAGELPDAVLGDAVAGERGRCRLTTGKRKQAQEHLSTSTTRYRDMDMRFWREQAEAELRALG